MNLAIFDLDNTLIAGDSDHLWGEFLVEQGLVDAEVYRQRNDQFYEDYRNCVLDIRAYLCFALAPLARIAPDRLAELHRMFMDCKISQAMLPRARALVEEHRQRGDHLMVITATNSFVAGPIVRSLGIETLLASEAERDGVAYTGRPTGIPCYQDGKVKRLQAWLDSRPEPFEQTWFYSDSKNDLPLLALVDHPVAVDPDPALREHALASGWPVITLREAV